MCGYAVIERSDAVPAPPNKAMELTIKSVLSLAKRRARATPLSLAAHRRR